jgi:ATP-dependent Clp protease protease subunit
MSQPTLRFLVRGEGSETLELDIYDTIGESWWGEGVTAKSVRRALKEAKAAKTIKLRVNSRGGDVFDGFAIFNLLHDHPARVEAEVDALAASMASVILMAADEIRVAKTAMIMIHNPWTLAMGEAEDLRGTADLLDKIREQIAHAYVARTGLDRARVLEMMDAETWMTADEAKENGFADVVKPAPKGPAKAKAFGSLDVRDFEHVPSFFAAAIDEARRRHPQPDDAALAAMAHGAGRTDMDLKVIAALLGLRSDASEADIRSALQIASAASARLQSMTGHTDTGAAIATVEAWRTSHARVEELNAQLLTERKTREDAAAMTAITAAVEGGKLAPASRETAEKLYREHGAGALAAFLSALQPVVRVGASAKPAPGPTASLTDEEREIAEQLGLSEAEALDNKKRFGAQTEG